MIENEKKSMLTFDGHINVLKCLLIRVFLVVTVTSIVVFCLKAETFNLLLAPSKCDFIIYGWIEHLMRLLDSDFCFDKFEIKLISTELSSQFMVHVKTSILLGLLCVSPYILYEMFNFIMPALYKKERRCSIRILLIVYSLFLLGVLMTYYVLFPISFRFLGTYSVSEQIHSTITLDSYISTFITLTLMMGVVFQLPVITFVLGKMGFINCILLAKYRRHAFIVIMTIAAIITPPDIMTLIIVTIPLYLLFELSIFVLKLINKDV